ncbi:MAG: response regulator transcription factor [Spirochaetes bacterium]|nr:response regulator transcription factor [Spirochaetota bacterium]
MSEKKSVIIVDDHPAVREGLKSIIRENGNLEVIAETGNGEQGLLLIGKYKPDLVLLDLSLQNANGIELTRRISKDMPGTKVLILSVHSKVDYIKEAFLAGARGYIIKESAPDKLMEGIEKVLEGSYFMDSYVSHEVIEGILMGDTRVSQAKTDAYGSLSNREQQVLRFLAEGMQTKEIAEKLFISTKTVENHRSHIMKKLEIKSMVELIRYAAKIGLIDIDLWKG